MVKKEISIRRVKELNIIEKRDEVAIEHELSVPLRNGKIINVTCTPAHLEEMILARRYLAGDLTEKERSQMGLQFQAADNLLTQISLEEIFRIARDSFENPGPLFAETGCAHSCALVHKGEVVCCIEDIGRHNALDKVIGYALKHKISIRNSYIFSSGRISKDYLHKAAEAGFRMVVSRAAVTDAAVALAREQGITMLGFIRKNAGNIYCENKVSLIL